MKIFAKRKRVVEKGPSKEQENETKTFESDEVVKELLKQDPSTWNAKQRRLIKRYQERNPNTDSVVDEFNLPSSVQEGSDIELLLCSDSILKTTEIEESHAQSEKVDNDDESKGVAEEDGNEESDSANDDDDDDNEEDDDDDDDDEEDNDDEYEEETNDATTNVKEATQSDTPNLAITDKVDGSSIDDELKAMLDKLNSKQRRTLMRQYDRDTNIEQLRNETIRLLHENETAANAAASLTTTTIVEEVIEEPPTKKRRRRGPVVDETKLSPEERMRREEQRRLQALARDSSTTASQIDSDMKSDKDQSKHRHPLNSERRRANRRKPKWEVTSKKKFAPNEHDTSGYHMRKVTKST